MGGADGDDLITAFFKGGTIFGGGTGVGVDDEDSGAASAYGMGFDRSDAGLLHGGMEMNGDVMALVRANNGANDLSTLSWRGRIGDAGVRENDFESLADPVARAAGGKEEAVAGDVDGATDFLKRFDSADTTPNEDRRGEFGTATAAAFAGFAGGVGRTRFGRGSHVGRRRSLSTAGHK